VATKENEKKRQERRRQTQQQPNLLFATDFIRQGETNSTAKKTFMEYQKNE
jgi:hypothetical protein